MPRAVHYTENETQVSINHGKPPVLQLKMKSGCRPRPKSTGSYTMQRKLEIVEYTRNANGVVTYSIQVEGNSGPMSAYTIRKRFGDFKKLYHTLLRKYGGRIDLPHLPAYGILNRLHAMLAADGVMELRMEQLQDMLTKIETSAIVLEDPDYLAFIGTAPCTPTGGYVSLARYASHAVNLPDQVKFAQMRKRAASEPALLRDLS